MTLHTEEGNIIKIEAPNPKETFFELFPELKLKEDENTKI
jgi:hypothetical protein